MLHCKIRFTIMCAELRHGCTVPSFFFKSRNSHYLGAIATRFFYLKVWFICETPTILRLEKSNEPIWVLYFVTVHLWCKEKMPESSLTPRETVAMYPNKHFTLMSEMRSLKTNQTNNPDARKGLLSFGSCKSERRGEKKGYVLKYRHRTECVDTTCKFIF